MSKDLTIHQPGAPFKQGYDPRRGRGPKKGAPNAGRPPDEFKRMLRALASREETLVALSAILADPDHPHFVQALKFVVERGYGPVERRAVPEGPTVVVVAPEKLTQAEWVAKYAPQSPSDGPTTGVEVQTYNQS